MIVINTIGLWMTAEMMMVINERIKAMAIREIDYSQCIRCHQCFDVCPMDVFRLFAGDVYIAYGEDCMSCFLCALECPQKCIAIDGFRAKEIPFPY